MRIRKINIVEGDFTYGQRLAIDDIFQNAELSEYGKLKACFVELYGWTPRILPPRMRVRWIDDMVAGIEHWVRVEQATLKYEPTEDERKAGIEDYSKNVGHLANIKALAKDYGIDPDALLAWKWAKVYGIMLTDLESFRYQQRLTEVSNRKYAATSKYKTHS